MTWLWIILGVVVGIVIGGAVILYFLGQMFRR